MSQFSDQNVRLNDLYERLFGERPFEQGMLLEDYYACITRIDLHFIQRFEALEKRLEAKL